MLLHTLVSVCLAVVSFTQAAKTGTTPKQSAVCTEYHDGLVKYGPVAALSHCVRLTCLENNCNMDLREDTLDVATECDLLLLRECGLQPMQDTQEACSNLVQKYLPAFKDNLMMHSNWYRVTCGGALPAHAERNTPAAPAHTSSQHKLQKVEETPSSSRTHVAKSDIAKPKAAVVLSATVTSATTLAPTPTSPVISAAVSPSSSAVPNSMVSAETLAQSSEPIIPSNKVETSRIIIYVCVGVGVAFLLCTAVAVIVIVRQRKAKEARMRWREESADDFSSDRISATLLPKHKPPPLPPKKKTSGVIGMPERGTKAV